MKITPDIIRHEFIGTDVKVAESRDPGCKGIRGKITDETKRTFTIFHKGKSKTIMKELTVFHFRYPDGTTVEVDGKLLHGRPEDRVKKTIRRLW